MSHLSLTESPRGITIRNIVNFFTHDNICQYFSLALSIDNAQVVATCIDRKK